ncbi:MAG: DNA polymerase III subunit delta [Anaerolineales bacterium]|nr:DNA polymerase III subunit delta [Anaerolineales bacterium]
MNNRKPNFYLFYGDDAFAIEEAEETMQSRLGNASISSMNISTFEADSADLNVLQQVCLSMPFLSDRRLIFLHRVEKLAQNREAREALLRVIDDLPPSSALVFTEILDLSKKDALSKYQKRSSWLAWIGANPERGYSRMYLRPRGAQFARWMVKYCISAGGEIGMEAAQLLASMVSEDTQLASLEMDKLIAYTGGKRAINTIDVEMLTPYHGQSDVFAMVDAIGNRQGKEASQRLHRMLEDRDSLFAFSMILRQFRLLTQIRECLDQGLNPSQCMKESQFVLNRLSPQARKFTLDELEKIIHQLLEIDLNSKSGRGDLDTALYTLTAVLTA